MLTEIQATFLRDPLQQQSSLHLLSSPCLSGDLVKVTCSLRFEILCPILSRLLSLTFIAFLSLRSALLILPRRQICSMVLYIKVFHKIPCKRLYPLVVKRLGKMSLQTMVIT